MNSIASKPPESHSHTGAAHSENVAATALAPKSRLPMGLLVLAASAAAIGATAYFGSFLGASGHQAATVAPPPAKVTIAPVEQRTLIDLALGGK